MDRQGPPKQPRYHLTGGLDRIRPRKRHDDVSLSRQEGCLMHHLANAYSVTGPAGGNTGWLFLLFGGNGQYKWFIIGPRGLQCETNQQEVKGRESIFFCVQI